MTKFDSTQNNLSTPSFNNKTSTSLPYDIFEKIATAVTNVSSTSTISSAQLNGLKNIFQAAASTSSRITSPVVTLPNSIPSINCNNKELIISPKSNSPTSNLSTVTVVELLKINRHQRSNSPKELKRKLANSPSNSQVKFFY